MKWVTHAQGSTEWLKSRIGVLTASRMADALAVTKTGESEKRRRLKYELLAERLSGRATEVFVNDAMKHGIKYEPEAREMYEALTGHLVETCGLAMFSDHIGASPDGLVDDDGLIEIKCPSFTMFLQYKIDGEVPAQYKPQMLLQLAVTERKWCDFVAYHPFLPAEVNTFIKRFEPTEQEKLAVLIAAENLNDEVKELHIQLLSNTLK